jgi:hypothetical protein
MLASSMVERGSEGSTPIHADAPSPAATYIDLTAELLGGTGLLQKSLRKGGRLRDFVGQKSPEKRTDFPSHFCRA